MEPLQGFAILIVEDDYFVARSLATLLQSCGARVLGPIGRMAEALAFLDERGADVDRAVLDINLHGETSYAIADILIARATKFVFVTGYGAANVDAGYRACPILEKPFEDEDLIAALV